MMGAMRFFQRGIAMTIVGFAVAMSLSYVIPNAQAVEPTAPEEAITRAGQPQIARTRAHELPHEPCPK